MDAIFEDIRKEIGAICEWLDSGNIIFSSPEFSCYQTDWCDQVSNSKENFVEVLALIEFLGLTVFGLSHGDENCNGFRSSECVVCIRQMGADTQSSTAGDLLRRLPEDWRRHMINRVLKDIMRPDWKGFSLRSLLKGFTSGEASRSTLARNELLRPFLAGFVNTLVYEDSKQWAALLDGNLQPLASFTGNENENDVRGTISALRELATHDLSYIVRLGRQAFVPFKKCKPNPKEWLLNVATELERLIGPGSIEAD